MQGWKCSDFFEIFRSVRERGPLARLFRYCSFFPIVSFLFCSVPFSSVLSQRTVIPFRSWWSAQTFLCTNLFGYKCFSKRTRVQSGLSQITVPSPVPFLVKNVSIPCCVLSQEDRGGGGYFRGVQDKSLVKKKLLKIFKK